MQDDTYVRWDHDHPKAFVDFPTKEPQPRFGMTKLCPVCRGHGGWNLELFAYGMPTGYDNTPENRHRYRHFTCMCSHCTGWGYTLESETCKGHEWKSVRSTGRCLTLYRCIHCKKEQEIDSSD